MAAYILALEIDRASSIIFKDRTGSITSPANCLLCIVYNYFLSESVNKVLCSAGNPDAVWRQTRKLNGVADHIPPQATVRRNNDCIVFMEFHLLKRQCIRIFAF